MRRADLRKDQCSATLPWWQPAGRLVRKQTKGLAGWRVERTDSSSTRPEGSIDADIAAGPDAAEERSSSAAIERSTAPVSGNFLRQLFGSNSLQQLSAVLGVGLRSD